MDIPLHSVVMVIGHNSKDKRNFIKNSFQDYEVVSKEKISNLYFGENTNSNTDFIIGEYLNLVKSKITLGERVVLVDNFFTNEERLFFINLAIQYSIKIYYILIDEIYDNNILNGDNHAEVIKDISELYIIQKFKSPINLFELKTKGFSGITVIPDIHGNIAALTKAVDWANSRNNLMVFLGDILDYGQNSIECVEMVYKLVSSGKAIMTKGNHERKIERWLAQQEKIEQNPDYLEKVQEINLTKSNLITVNQIKSLSEDKLFKFKIIYKSLMSWSANHWVIEDCLFTHGACEPEMFSIYNKSLHGKYEKLALYGEVDYTNPKRDDGYPNRIYNWVNRIPFGKTVFVGHDIRSNIKPYYEENSFGGQVYFLDTGCSKNGHLTTADIVIDNNKLVVTNFNQHI